jgi:hypothetical protein
VPAAIPVTTPVGETVATDVLLLVKLPPVIDGMSTIAAPAQTVDAPLRVTEAPGDDTVTL